MASKPYAVKFNGVDGKSTERFSTLWKASEYLKARFLGTEYIRGKDCLGSEFGYYTLIGFTLPDIGQYGTPDEDGWRDFHFFTEAELADPSTRRKFSGKYRIMEFHPVYDGRDAITGSHGIPVDYADDLEDAWRRLDRWTAQYDGDCPPDDLSWDVLDEHGRRLWRPHPQDYKPLEPGDIPF